MPALATDYFTKVGSPGSATTLSAPGHTIGATSWTVGATTNWSTDTGVIFAVDTVTLVNGVEVRNVGSYTEWEGVVASATSVTGTVLRYGTDQDYPANSLTRVYIPVASSERNRSVDGILTSLDQDGTLKAGAVDVTAVIADGIITKAKFATAEKAEFDSGWATRYGNTTFPAPTTVTALGNRSYQMVWNGVDLTGYINPGTRLRTTRTVAAPTQATSLNGTTQYYSKTTPTGSAFTTTFTCVAWVKLSSYQTGGIIARRNASTEGWSFGVNASGQLEITALRIAGNSKTGTTYQSLPLNRWVHVAASMDVTVGETTASTMYIDGVSVPYLGAITGTATALVQGTTALVVGSQQSAGANYFAGKIVQPAVFSSVLSSATILASMNQGLLGTETSLVSAYSFNGVITDLNTTNANDLTANGGAVATNADSPFGGQASGLISSTVDYGITQTAVFATNTTVVAQVSEGNTIPTSGGVSAVSYSSAKAPFGFPAESRKWRITSLLRTDFATTSNATYGAFISGGWALNVPIGAWNLGWMALLDNNTTTQVGFNISPTALTGLDIVAGHTTSPYTTRVSSPSAGTNVNTVYIEQSQRLASAATYVMYSIGATTGANVKGIISISEIFAVNDYL